jgi:hypothetical protein
MMNDDLQTQEEMLAAMVQAAQEAAAVMAEREAAYGDAMKPLPPPPVEIPAP